MDHLGLFDHLAHRRSPACRLHHELDRMAASRPTPPSCRRDGSGAVSVYVSNTTNVILDIDGYFAPPGSQNLSVLSADALPHRRHS